MAFFIVYAIIVPGAGGAGVGVCCRALEFYLQGDTDPVVVIDHKGAEIIGQQIGMPAADAEV